MGLLKMDFGRLQTEPQRDREASSRQNEHVHIGVECYGTDVRRDGAQAGQADGAAHGRAAPALGPRRAVRVPADRPPAPRLPLRARTQRAHPARRTRLLLARRRL